MWQMCCQCLPRSVWPFCPRAEARAPAHRTHRCVPLRLEIKQTNIWSLGVGFASAYYTTPFLPLPVRYLTIRLLTSLPNASERVVHKPLYDCTAPANAIGRPSAVAFSRATVLSITRPSLTSFLFPLIGVSLYKWPLYNTGRICTVVQKDVM